MRYGRIIFVRVTIDIPNALYRRLKSKAASEGRTVKELILRCAEAELRGKKPERPHRVSPPLVRSKTPGTVNLDNEKLFEIDPFP